MIHKYYNRDGNFLAEKEGAHCFVAEPRCSIFINNILVNTLITKQELDDENYILHVTLKTHYETGK